jgi:hypothetical protein
MKKCILQLNKNQSQRLYVEVHTKLRVPKPFDVGLVNLKTHRHKIQPAENHNERHKQ